MQLRPSGHKGHSRRPEISDNRSACWPALPAVVRSIIKVRNVIVRVPTVSLGGVVGDSQVIEAGQEYEDSDDEHGNGAIRIRNINVASQKQRPDDNQQRPDQEQERRQRDGFVRNFGWTPLEL